MKEFEPGIKYVYKVKEFGEDNLLLNFRNSFSRFKKSSTTINWLYVSYKDRISSVLSYNGKSFPFKSSWDINNLKRAKRWYDCNGFDTYLFSAEAHGGGNCPISTALLNSDRARQGYVILHEGWHTTIASKKVNMPYPLEEATGRIVGNFGIINFAKHIKDEALIKEAIAQENDWQRFTKFVNHWHKHMTRLYMTTKGEDLLRKREEEFKVVNLRAKKLASTFETTWDKQELLKPINNAFLLRYYDYTRYYEPARKIIIKLQSLMEAKEVFLNPDSKLRLKIKN